MRRSLKPPVLRPCRFCGAMPQFRSVDIYFRPSGDYISTQIEFECSNVKCSKEHRHFRPRATKREAMLAWNARQ
jgi:hypothetical protein